MYFDIYCKHHDQFDAWSYGIFWFYLSTNHLAFGIIYINILIGSGGSNAEPKQQGTK